MENIEEMNNQLIKKFQNGDNDAFNELYELNIKLIKKYINKFSHIKRLDEHDLWSIASNAFLRTAKSFKEGKGKKFSSLYVTNFYGDVYTALDYFNRSGRQEGLKKTFSYHNTTSNHKNEEEKSMEHLLVGYEDKYFENQFQDTTIEILQTAINKVRKDVQPYIMKIINGDIEQIAVSNLLGISRKVVSYQVKVFKSEFKELWELFGMETV